jgi:hypothetical protein
MRKEVLIAVVAGSLLGLTIAFGIWRANVALSPKVNSSNPTPTPSENHINGLTIASPNDFEVIVETPTKIAGISSLKSLVVISGEVEDYFVTPSQDGAFDVEIDLVEAANQIVIVAFDLDGNQVEKRLILSLSTEFAKIVSSPTPSTQEDQEATDSVREKVQDKVSAARSSPKFILGTITDKLETTLEVKTQKGEIAQVSASDDLTTFIKIDKTKKEVKYADVAIGDFILAMGFQNGNAVLDSRRVLITSPLEETTRRVILGTISDVQRTQVSVDSLKGEEKVTFSNTKDLTIFEEVDSGVDEINFTDLKKDQKIVVVGSTEDGKFSARTVRVLAE